MSFTTTFRLSNTILMFLGFIALVLSGFLNPWIFCLPLGAVLLNEHPLSRDWGKRLPIPLVNTATVAMLLYCIAVPFILREDLVAAVIYFTIFLQVLKTLTATKNRDFFQIYILAFTHLISATLLSNNLTFTIPFVFFMIFAPWCFTLFNLKSQLEAAEKEDRVAQILKSRDMVGGRFFSITALISLVLLINTMAIFFLFPRVSFGFLFKRVKPVTSSAGFSDRVDLGIFGEIKTNDAIVMRIEMEEKPSNEFIEGLYWRGLTYDVYENQKWSRSLSHLKSLSVNMDDGRLEVRKRPNPVQLFEQRITLEPLETRVLFAADRLYDLAWNKLQVERMLRVDFKIDRDPYLSLYFHSALVSDRQYIAYSGVQPPSDEELKVDTERGELPDGFLAHYTQLPEAVAPLQKLAEQIGRGLTNDFERSHAVRQYLQSKYQYSLRVPAMQGEPIVDFLTRTKQGHCELFATAGVVLMRALGVPSRLVSGFRGGDWNEVGGFTTVRQRDAHTWVEVWYPTYGWQRIDPTPADESASDYMTLRFEKFRKVIDYLELRWYRYIVNYDLQSQYLAATGSWDKLQKAFSGLSASERKSFWDRLQERFAGSGSRHAELPLGPMLLGTLLLVALIVLTLRLYRRRTLKQNPLQHHPIAILWRRYESYLARAGFKRLPYQTPQEFHAELPSKIPNRSLGQELLQAYYDVRFGSRRVEPTQIARLTKWLQSLLG